MHMNTQNGDIDRRDFVQGALTTAAALAVGLRPSINLRRPPDDVIAQIAIQHDKTVKMVQDWIALPSIAAENRGYPQGAEYMANLARDAGFQRVDIIPTAGKPGVFATLDAGAKSSLGVYFMYDVKQYDPSEWSSPPLEARLVDKPGLGKIIVGRGATNTKGPQIAFLAALHAFKAVGKKPPVNIVMVCEGEEEIGSPNFSQIVFKPEVEAALRECLGIIIPLGSQDLDGAVQINLGAKGVVELELVSSGETWGRGPKHDVHSSLEAQLDSPSWHLVRALNILVQADGHTPAVEGFFDEIMTGAPRVLLRLGEDRGDVSILKHLGQSVAAQNKEIVVGERRRRDFGKHLETHAETLCQHVPVRIGAGRRIIDQPSFQQDGHERVIARKLRQGAAMKPVGAAVAQMSDIGDGR